jgi:hypothetical protein
VNKQDYANSLNVVLLVIWDQSSMPSLIVKQWHPL